MVNLSDPAKPGSLGTLPVDGHECVVRDGKAYVSSDSGLSVFDVSNPTEPRFLGASTNAGQLVIGKGLVVSGSYVFMGNNLGGLAAFELNAMDVPKQIASYAHSSWADSVAMSGDFIFAPDYGTGVKIYRNDNAGLRLKLSPAAFQVLNATPGGRYVLERTVGLSAPGSWTPLATNTIQNYTASFPTTASGGDREFFRLRKTE